MILQAVSIGRLASQALHECWPASVTGVTSGGVFVRAADRRIIFLTYSPFHGPNTINLAPSHLDLQRFEQGQGVVLSPGRIKFEDSQHSVNLSAAILWEPGRPLVQMIEWPQVAIRLRRVVLNAAQAKGDEGFTPVLPALVGAGPFRVGGDLSPALLEALKSAAGFCAEGNYAAAVEAGFRWVGYGRGLTPAGDDCLAGMLLVLNRWGPSVFPGLDTIQINQPTIQFIRSRTTLLSATIILAATLAEADERILDVLDGILTGNFNEDQTVERLVKMGHSSGVDTLAGIALVLASKVPTISERI